MSDTQGVAPPNYATDIGQLRAVINDIHWEPLVPAVPGQGSYQFFGDDQLQVFLDRSGGDVDKAAAYAWRSIGDIYAAESASITTDDLRVADLWRRAQFFYDRADKADAAGADDIFALAPLGHSCGCRCHAELAEPFWPFGLMGCCSCR